MAKHKTRNKRIMEKPKYISNLERINNTRKKD